MQSLKAPLPNDPDLRGGAAKNRGDQTNLRSRQVARQSYLPNDPKPRRRTGTSECQTNPRSQLRQARMLVATPVENRVSVAPASIPTAFSTCLSTQTSWSAFCNHIIHFTRQRTAQFNYCPRKGDFFICARKT